MWDDSCKDSFEALKTFLTSPPILARALPREILKVYISASDGSVASVLVKDVEGREASVYYVSHTLKDAKTRYPHVEKLVYTLVITSRKLRHYFQGRSIKVMIDQPLKRILHRPDMTGRLATWTIELSQFHIKYLPRSAMKSQILSDFDSEYEALLAGIRLAIELEVKVLEIFGDSHLVAKQLQGEFKAHDVRMSAYLNLVVSLLGKVSSWTIKNICREEIQWVDALSKLASSVVVTSEIYGSISHQPLVEMILVVNPCPFYQLGIDIVGPFPKSKNQAQYIVVVVDYVTKWIEARPLAKICGKEMVEFLMEYIIFRFVVPRIVVTDNGTQFVGEKFTQILSQLRIKHIKSSVAYPQANGQVEVSNRIILQGLKKRVDELPRSWVDEFPNILWPYRMTFRSATGISPFKMAFVLEAVSPVEVYLNSLRVEYFDAEAS
ncbi:uncharacterized protein LOC141661177 [Apium graveolens]|uniref:uncharacterized protein LOC141661177 n=1 Tax=Apium graveolens TaxID=4045 RepID=UPI003D7A4D8C